MIRVRVCRLVRVCVLEPRISACFFLLDLLLLLTATDTTTTRVLTTAMQVWSYACMRCVCAPCTCSHGTTTFAQLVSVHHFYACVDIAYICVMCDVCAMIRKHVTCATTTITYCRTSIIMFKVYSGTQPGCCTSIIKYSKVNKFSAGQEFLLLITTRY